MIPIASHGCLLHGIGQVRAKADAEPLADAEWRSVEAIKQATEEPVTRLISDLFAAQLHGLLLALPNVLANTDARKSPDAYIDPFAVEQLLPEEWNAWLEDRLREHLIRIGASGYATAGIRIDIELSAFRPSSLTQDILSEIIGRTKGINQTSKNEIQELILQGLRNDDSIDEITNRITEKFTNWQSWRAKMVAQTAATPAFEVSQLQAYADAGIGRMGWLSQRDGRVRRTHQFIDFQKEIVKVGDQFSNGLRFPGDPLGLPKEIINCRCTSMPHSDTFKMGGLDIDKFNDRERSRIDLSIRDYSIRSSYRGLRKEHGQTEALASLAEQYFCSESTVRRAVWG